VAGLGFDVFNRSQHFGGKWGYDGKNFLFRDFLRFIKIISTYAEVYPMAYSITVDERCGEF
jgi:hypothetical protein